MLSLWIQLCTSLPRGSDVSFHSILKNNTGTDADVRKCELQPPTKNNPKLTQQELLECFCVGECVCVCVCVFVSVCVCVCGSMLEWAGLSMRGYDFLKDSINVSSADPDPQPPSPSCLPLCIASTRSQENVSLSQTTLKTTERAIPISAISELPYPESFNLISPHPCLIIAHLKYK